MIREHSVHVRSKNNNAKITFGVLLILAGALILTSMIVELYRGVISLAGIVFLTAAVLVHTKYIGAEYYYDVTFDSSGYPLLVVRQTVGKRHSTLCRIGLSEINSVDRETASERRAHKTPYGVRKYVYVPTMGTDVTYRLITKSRYEEAEIILEISDEFAELLSSYAKEAKTMVIEDDDF